MTSLTASELATRHHRRAIRFFWSWLLGATVLSLAGNVAHAVLTAPPDTRWLAAAVATVPPIVLLAAVHGIAVLVKTNVSGAVYRASVAATAALAWGAFLLSFVALRDLAVLAGTAPQLAVMLPLVIDLAAAVSTVALVAVGDKPTRRPRSATVTAPSSANPRAAGATPRRAVPAPAAPSNATAELAAELVAAKATRQPAAVVEAILEAHQKGDPLNRIAAALGVHHSVVKRILEAVEASPQPGQLSAV